MMTPYRDGLWTRATLAPGSVTAFSRAVLPPGKPRPAPVPPKRRQAARRAPYSGRWVTYYGRQVNGRVLRAALRLRDRPGSTYRRIVVVSPTCVIVK